MTSEEHWERLQHYVPHEAPLRFREDGAPQPALPRAAGVNGATTAGGEPATGPRQQPPPREAGQ